MSKSRFKVVARSEGRVLQVYGEADVTDCEAMMDAMASLPPAPRIQVATAWKLDASPGGAAAALQAGISWARAPDEPTLVTHAPAEAPPTSSKGFASARTGPAPS